MLAVSLALACSRRGPQDAALGATVLPAQVAPEAPAAPLTDPECRADVDCVPVSCCGQITADGCVPRASGPRNCEAVECPRPANNALRCACRAGRCAGVR